MPDDRPQILRPELVFGIVGPMGSDSSSVATSLREALENSGYQVDPDPISPIDELCEGAYEPWNQLKYEYLDERYKKYIDNGNNFCEKLKRGDALAVLAISAIRKRRGELVGDGDDPGEIPDGRAYIIKSLKRLEEVETLRNVYGGAFILVAAYAPRSARIHSLAKRFASSHGSNSSQSFERIATELVDRDEREQEPAFGQNIRGVFPQADVFINSTDKREIDKSTTRFVELLLEHSFHTPSPDEHCMFLASGAALRSSDQSRQVGAVIATEDGDIVAVGSNEVPRGGGGQYWPHHTPDHRDWTEREDSSERMKKATLQEVLVKLRENGRLSGSSSALSTQELVKQVLGEMEGSQVENLIEFGRVEHAEMAALLEAARRGVSVKDCVLYTTTFPCHDCARHIITAGIARVVYVDPYPKSLALELHDDSIGVDQQATCDGNERVNFEPFVGIAPVCYMNMFKRFKRKGWRKETGKRFLFRPKTFENKSLYLPEELRVMKEFDAQARLHISDRGATPVLDQVTSTQPEKS